MDNKQSLKREERTWSEVAHDDNDKDRKPEFEKKDQENKEEESRPKPSSKPTYFEKEKEFEKDERFEPNNLEKKESYKSELFSVQDPFASMFSSSFCLLPYFSKSYLLFISFLILVSKAYKSELSSVQDPFASMFTSSFCLFPYFFYYYFDNNFISCLLFSFLILVYKD